MNANSSRLAVGRRWRNNKTIFARNVARMVMLRSKSAPGSLSPSTGHKVTCTKSPPATKAIQLRTLVVAESRTRAQEVASSSLTHCSFEYNRGQAAHAHLPLS